VKSSLVLVLVVLGGGCRDNPIFDETPDMAVGIVQDMAKRSGGGSGGTGGGGGGSGGTGGGGGDGGPTLASHQVDVLFMVDNSPSMDSMQTQLKEKFDNFLRPLTQLGKAVDLQIGVVTSDYGAGNTANLSGGCDKSPGGQRGLLQSTAALGTPEAMAGCKGPVGAPFIRYALDAGGNVTTSNLPDGATDAASLVSTFTCMASVGSNGCGFEHQLESVYAALHNTVENAGFLRPDALLVVVFVTNEDDGSAPPTTDVFNPDPAKAAPPPAGYGAIDTYRQTDFGVACMIGGMLKLTPYGDSGGQLFGCEAAPNNSSVMLGSEFDVSRYILYFTQPTSRGGVKVDPNNVILAAIDAPEAPFSILQVAAGTGNGKGAYPNPAAYQPCPAPNTVDGKNCLVRLQHSCQNTVQPGFFGDPAVRLNTVVRSVMAWQISSICGGNLTQTPDYSTAMTSISDLIKARLY
jgi:hypothetical protein